MRKNIIVKKEDIQTNLDKSLSKFGRHIQERSNNITVFIDKLVFLFETSRYDKLLNNLFSASGLDRFNDIVFEALFAYDFESKGHKLDYEVEKIPESGSSIDFCYKLDNQIEMCFELLRKRDTKRITTIQKTEHYIKWETYSNEVDDRNSKINLRNALIGKCVKNGKPIKFSKGKKGTYNFIVVNVEDFHFGHITEEDCILVMYGISFVKTSIQTNESILFYWNYDIFGLFENLRPNSTDKDKEYYNESQHFRETIHGVLFVKMTGDAFCFINKRLCKSGVGIQTYSKHKFITTRGK
mgnify:CR=1 FL=1